MGDQQRPNIVFAIADDASHMSAYGHGFVQTPVFDRVAAEGVLFTNAFTTNPKCAPSRASILTGRQTWTLEEAAIHYGIFPAKFSVYPDLLEAAGYHVGFTGKGWAPGDYRRGGRSRNPAGPQYNDRYLTAPQGTKISSRDYAANFDDFLAARPDGAPFCFWYGAHEPHRPYAEGEGARAGKDPSSARPPRYLPDDPVVRSDLADYAYEVEWFDSQLGRILERLDAAGELENTLVIVTSDNGMPFPRVKGQMYEQDFNLPLAIRWPGEIPGGRVVHDLVSFIDFAPTMLEAAGVDPAPGMSGSSLLSLLRSYEEGLVDASRDRVYMGRENHDLGREGDRGYPVRCVRTREYLYVRNFAPDRWPAGNPETGFTNCDSSPTKRLILQQHAAGDDTFFSPAFGKRPAEELYDISADPECLENLAGDAGYDEIRGALRDDLEQELRATDDPRIQGNGDVFDSYEYTGSDAHSWKAWVEGRFEPQWF